MLIHVVQSGENIFSIADRYGVRASKLIQDNELDNPYELVLGQTIVVVYPEQEHTVREGDSLGSIANAYGISLMQLLRNNPLLIGRDVIYPGETLTISYKTERQAVTNGFAYPYIKSDVLRKTLPYLTYLSIFNYTATKEGNIVAYEDDTDLIRTTLEFGTIPLLMLTTLTVRGEPNLEVAYEILTNEDYQNHMIDNIVAILSTKGYMGVNMIFNYMNIMNQELYYKLINKTSERLKKNGYLFFITINPSFRINNNVLEFDKVNLSGIEQKVDGITFMRFVWGTNTEAPGPVSSDYYLSEYIKYMLNDVPADYIEVGIPIIGYQWQLPYINGKTNANSLTINSCISLASDTKSVIIFDEISKTPYFEFNQFTFSFPSNNIVWFIDARSIDSLANLVINNQLKGTGIWNIMVYYAQMWLVNNARFDIIKLLPDQL